MHICVIGHQEICDSIPNREIAMFLEQASLKSVFKVLTISTLKRFKNLPLAPEIDNSFVGHKVNCRPPDTDRQPQSRSTLPSKASRTRGFSLRRGKMTLGRKIRTVRKTQSIPPPRSESIEKYCGAGLP